MRDNVARRTSFKELLSEGAVKLEVLALEHRARGRKNRYRTPFRHTHENFSAADIIQHIKMGVVARGGKEKKTFPGVRQVREISLADEHLFVRPYARVSVAAEIQHDGSLIDMVDDCLIDVG